MIKKLKNNKGYTLLFAVLVSSVVLSVGISILTISKKEFLLSSAVRESVSAFYSADSGLECAIKHDEAGVFIGPNTSPPNCMGGSVKIMPSPLSFGSEGISTTTFQVKILDNKGSCAIVTVARFIYNDPSLGPIPMTSIESRGYNLGWDSNKINDTTVGPCSAISVRRVERAIKYTY